MQTIDTAAQILIHALLRMILRTSTSAILIHKSHVLVMIMELHVCVTKITVTVVEVNVLVIVLAPLVHKIVTVLKMDTSVVKVLDYANCLKMIVHVLQHL